MAVPALSNVLKRVLTRFLHQARLLSHPRAKVTILLFLRPCDPVVVLHRTTRTIACLAASQLPASLLRFTGRRRPCPNRRLCTTSAPEHYDLALHLPTSTLTLRPMHPPASPAARVLHHLRPATTLLHHRMHPQWDTQPVIQDATASRLPCRPNLVTLSHRPLHTILSIP